MSAPQPASLWDRDLFTLAERVFDECPEPEQQFKSYQVERFLGAGGMGEVYLAKDPASGRTVAIKRLRTAWFDPERVARFRREIQTLGQLEHDSIAHLYEADVQADGTPYFVMQYVDGEPLNVFCQREQYGLHDRLRLLRAVCDAVQFAHQRGIIHLDLKPSNILITKSGAPKLLDFGIARQLSDPGGVAEQTQLRFTPTFAAPEQLLQKPVGTYTDVYALGVILYELLAGQLPQEAYRAPSLAPGRVAATKSEWRDLDRLCSRAMATDVADRYKTVGQFAADLANFEHHRPLRAGPNRVSYRAAKFLRRNWQSLAAAAAVLAVLAGMAVFYTIRLRSARDAAERQAKRAEDVQALTLKIIGGGLNTAPSKDLRVADLLDSAVKQARLLKDQPQVRSDLFYTLGGLDLNLGNLNQADELLESSWELREKYDGIGSYQAGEAAVLVAQTRLDQAKYAEGEQLARAEAQRAGEHLPSQHKLMMESLVLVAGALEHEGRFAEAIATARDVLASSGNRPDESFNRAEAQIYLAASYQMSGQLRAASGPLHRVLADAERTNGHRGEEVARDFSNLSSLELAMGEYSNAERDAREALRITNEWFGKRILATALTEIGLSNALLFTHKYAEAHAILNQAVPYMEQNAGATHPFAAIGYGVEGLLALREHDPRAAEADFARMRTVYATHFKAPERHIAVSYLYLGQAAMAEGRLRAGEDDFRQALAMYRTAYGESSLLTGIAEIRLGDSLFQQNKPAEARPLLQQGEATALREADPHLEETALAQRDLAALNPAAAR